MNSGVEKTYFLPTLPSLLVDSGKPLIHRDLSWLQFNQRVLAEARSSSNPLLERLKFLAITASNLDEFFMIRFSHLKSERIRNSLLETVSTFITKQGETLDLLSSALESKKVFITRQPKEDEETFALGEKLFMKEIFPQLSPPEPFSVSWVSTLENLQMAAVFPSGMGWKISRQIPTVWLVPGEKRVGTYVFFLDDLLNSHLGKSFRVDGQPGFLRLTRDGDFSLDVHDEDPASIPEQVRKGIGSREKGKPVRLQYWGELPPDLLVQCQNSFKWSSAQIIPAPGSLLLHGLWTVFHQLPDEIKNSPELSYPKLQATTPEMLLVTKNIFDRIRQRDLILHHPYDAFDAYVQFIKAACLDPKVTRIQQTVYRMDAESAVMDALKKAASKKKIRVVIELRARFDELNNLSLADELRKAGVEVAFGFGQLKLHAKVACVERNEDGKVQTYTHLSTGNYNSKTARLYEDFGILTAHPEFGEDAIKFFDAVCERKVPGAFKRLVAAPTRLHRRLIGLIQEETEAALQKKGEARIVAKVNALIDEEVIESLYAASRAGVQVDLIVRGACSLIPGVKGLSENIRVISVVDRFLEHSRFYYFASSKQFYFSSADWMPRNFFSRLELAFPVADPDLMKFLEEVVIPVYLCDTVRGQELTQQGIWKKRAASSIRSRLKKLQAVLSPEGPIRSQFYFEALAKKHYQGTPLEKKKSPEKP